MGTRLASQFIMYPPVSYSLRHLVEDIFKAMGHPSPNIYTKLVINLFDHAFPNDLIQRMGDTRLTPLLTMIHTSWLAIFVCEGPLFLEIVGFDTLIVLSGNVVVFPARLYFRVKNDGSLLLPKPVTITLAF